jgi:ABC-type dipeptide/oligopeptide/nickel transport system permease subunit
LGSVASSELEYAPIEYIGHGHIYQAIIDAAEARKCDLIVMASPGRRGVSAVVLVAGHIVPQCIPTFLVLATAHLGTAIVIEATLGFHGIGITPPTASWGNMLGGVVANTYKPLWWLVVFPGLSISLTVLAFNLLGDTLRDILDPKMRGW